MLSGLFGFRFSPFSILVSGCELDHSKADKLIIPMQFQVASRYQSSDSDEIPNTFSLPTKSPVSMLATDLDTSLYVAQDLGSSLLSLNGYCAYLCSTDRMLPDDGQQEIRVTNSKVSFQTQNRNRDELPSSPLLPSQNSVAWYRNRKNDESSILGSSPISPCFVKTVSEEDGFSTGVESDDQDSLCPGSNRLGSLYTSSPLSSPINSRSITNVQHPLKFDDQNESLPPRPVFKGFATKTTKCSIFNQDYCVSLE